MLEALERHLEERVFLGRAFTTVGRVLVQGAKVLRDEHVGASESGAFTRAAMRGRGDSSRSGLSHDEYGRVAIEVAEELEKPPQDAQVPAVIVRVLFAEPWVTDLYLEMRDTSHG